MLPFGIDFSFSFMSVQHKHVKLLIHVQVLIDGVPLTEVDAQWYRSQIGVVAQDPRLFSNTITANITYGCTGKSQVCWGPFATARWLKPPCCMLTFWGNAYLPHECRSLFSLMASVV